MNRTNNPPSTHTENAGLPAMEGKMLRIEHEWLPRHVQAYLEDGKAYTIHLKNGAVMLNAVFHRDPLFDYHWFTVGGTVHSIEQVYSHSV